MKYIGKKIKRIQEIHRMKKSHEVNRSLCVKTKNGRYSDDGKNRETLTVYWDSEYDKKAIVIGINPSKANDERSDKTLTTAGRFLDAYEISEFTMLNLFASYSTQQDGIKKETLIDLSDYKKDFEKNDLIVIAWGVDNNYCKEKERALNIIKDYKEKVYCIEKKGSMPLHPSRISYESNLVKYKIN